MVNAVPEGGGSAPSDDWVETGGSGATAFSIDHAAAMAGRNKIGDAIEALVKARDKLDKAEDPGHEDCFGKSSEAGHVVKKWIGSVRHRRAEIEELIEQTGGVYAAIQISAQRYFESDLINKTNFTETDPNNDVTASDEIRYVNEYGKDPAGIKRDPDEGIASLGGVSMSSVANKLNILEGHDPREHPAGPTKDQVFGSAAEAGSRGGARAGGTVVDP